MKHTKAAILDYQNAHAGGISTSSKNRACGWTAPPTGWILAHWDVTIDRSLRRLGLGVILRDNAGNLIAAKCLTRRGHVEPAAAEAMAALEATQLCRDMGYEQIHFMRDAKTVVDAVNLGVPNWSRTGHLINDIRTKLQELSHWKLSYVSREMNRPAHELAKMERDNLWIRCGSQPHLLVFRNSLLLSNLVCPFDY